MVRDDPASLTQARSGAVAPVPAIVCASAEMQAVLHVADRLAAGDAKVLITGESGVGKDLIARYIHARSRRAGQRYVAVNCGALADTLLEAELFGHARGSFTGADRDRLGKLAFADGGTVFLDEVSEMSTRMQVVLLRFLESGEIQPVGTSQPSARIDVRVLAATNRNLGEMVQDGLFREDLLYRLRVGHILVPPLRERRADIVPLIEHTLGRSGRRVRFGDDALDVLTSYSWPGNVRELQNIVEQAVCMAHRAGDEEVIVSAAELPITRHTTAISTPERRRQIADDLYEGLASNAFSFWGEIHELFLGRDITRHDMRELVRRGLITTCGNYRALVTLFGMEPDDYKRFLNFLSAHGCNVDPRPFRTGKPLPSPRRSLQIVPFPRRRPSPAADKQRA